LRAAGALATSMTAAEDDPPRIEPTSAQIRLLCAPACEVVHGNDELGSQNN
jgi:hypothetical protein